MFKKLNIRFLLTAGLQSQESLKMQLNINNPVSWQLIQVSNIRIERILVCDPSSWTIIVYSLLCLQNTNNWLFLYSAPSNNNYLASEGHYNSTLQYTFSGPDTGLSIVNSGAIKAMASISRQDLNDRHLWSETILPEGIPVNRSLSLSEQRKSNHTLVMSDSLVKTLDTLHPDEFIHGR